MEGKFHPTAKIETAEKWISEEIRTYTMAENAFGELNESQREAKRNLEVALTCVRKVMEEEYGH